MSHKAKLHNYVSINNKNRGGKIFTSSLILLGLILLFFARRLFYFDSHFIGGEDIKVLHWWNEYFVKEQFLNGSFPLWNPYYFCGYPFFANPGNFVFYPSTLFYILLPLPFAFTLDTILHIFIAGLGAYCFTDILFRSRWAGISAAIVFSLSGYFVSKVNAGHINVIHTAAILPWVFFYTEKAFQQNRARNLAITGVLIGIQVLSGHPQITFYSAFFITVYFFIRYIANLYNPAYPFNFKFGIYYILIPVIAFGISAVQLLPTYEFKELSVRTLNSYDFATFMSFPFKSFFAFLVPFNISQQFVDFENVGYLGILSVVLGVIGFISAKNSDRWCFGIILCIAVSMMLGSNSPVYKFYLHFFPMLSNFRIPARCIVIFILFMSILVGGGVKALIEIQLSQKLKYLSLIVWSLLFFSVIIFAWFFHISILSKELIALLFVSIIHLGTLVICTILRKKRIIPFLIIIALFLDFCLLISSTIPMLEKKNFETDLPVENYLKQDHGFYRVNFPSEIANRASKYHYFCINGYAPIITGSYYNFCHKMADTPAPKFRQHTLSSLFSIDSNMAYKTKILCFKFNTVLTGNNSEYKTSAAYHVMPWAVVVEKTKYLDEWEDHIDFMKRPDFDPEKLLLLKTPTYHQNRISESEQTDPLTEKFVQITSYKPNKIDLKTQTDKNAYLVLSEMYYPGWHAYIDGKEVEIIRANYLLRAVQLNAGQHDVTFLYRPLSLKVGAGISVFTIIILLILFISPKKFSFFGGNNQ